MSIMWSCFYYYKEGWRRVIAQSLKSITRINKQENVEVVYNLIFKNALYNVECYKEGGSKNNPNQYCFLEDITEDEGEAEAFLYLMAKGKVFPVHINDMVEDYFAD
jgi:hypothetical protein